MINLQFKVYHFCPANHEALLIDHVNATVYIVI